MNGVNVVGPNRIFSDIDPTKDYVLTAWVNPISTTGKIELRALISGATSTTKSNLISINTMPRKWNQVSMRIPGSEIKSYFATTNGTIKVSCGTGAEGGEFYVDDIRFHPATSKMTTVTYDLGTGKVTSITGPDNVPTYYSYDDYGRLNQIKNADHEILKNVDYKVDRKENCYNNVDDNGDGLIDCNDPECNCTP
jgi:YD repeat-containing protein